MIAPETWLNGFDKAAFKDQVRPLILKQNPMRLLGVSESRSRMNPLMKRNGQLLLLHTPGRSFAAAVPEAGAKSLVQPGEPCFSRDTSAQYTGDNL